jgi:sporulation protein YlmC with PRC-barrel domain
MDQQNSSGQAHPKIVVGAVVEATDGFVGTVEAVVSDPATGRISQLVIQNESESKQFTISADLIARQIGSRIIHLSIPRDQLVDRAEDTEFDSNTGNFGTPMQPTSEK